MSRSARNHYLLMISAFCLPIVLLAACGKKGPPTLTSFEKPDAPSSVTAVHRGEVITLRWNYPRKQEGFIAEFIVLRSTGADFEKLSHLEKDKRTFVDSDIKTGITYRYKIISQNSHGVYSDDSPIVEATPAPAPLPPASLSYTVKGNSVVLSWTPLNTGEKFNVYKATEKGAYGLMPLNQTPLSEPVFTDAFSVKSVVYYTVRSLSGSDIRDEGEASEELAVDPADLVPARPENVEAYPASDRIFLSWSEPVEPWVTGFRVYKRTGSSEYILLGETQIPTFVDNDRSVARRDYRITAVGPAKEGPPAEIMNVVYTPQR
jgi:predicted small lipoprotein YifL